MNSKFFFKAVVLAAFWAQAANADMTDTPPATEQQAVDASINSPKVRIDHFQITGNTLLAAEMIEKLLAPYTGEGRTFTDIQRALEALEGAYRSAGYGAVNVATREQDITEGIVVLEVIESVIGEVAISGNQYYGSNNIRRALPSLLEGKTPSARKLSENIRLANENSTRQLDVVLALSEQEGQVDARINVEDSSPHKFFLTMDNTGNQNSGMYRTGMGYQHNNLFDRDQAATLNYSTSPSHVRQVTQISGSYRLPLYSVGDSIDLIAAYSDTNAGTTNTVAGPLSFSGKGDVLSARYNYYLPREGDLVAKIVMGLDYRIYLNNCSLGTLGAAGCGSAGASVTVHPFSAAYSSTLTTPTYVIDYTASLIRNIPGGARGGASDFNAVRPSPTGGAGANADYTVLRLNGSLAGAVSDGWQYRVAANAQYTPGALISGESFGLVGANAVRGFLEREFSSDKGYVANFELYTPELAEALKLSSGSFRLLGFLDQAQGWKVALAGESRDHISVGSAGVGFRLTYSKNITVKFDWARVLDTAGSVVAGSQRGQINIVGTW
jgi:hemolysin activation/secretion protein